MKQGRKRVLRRIGPAFQRTRNRKYQYILKRFKTPKEPKKGRKALLIQIDALSRSDLFRAIDRGYLHTLRKLLRKKGYRVQRVNPGLPSNTGHFHSSVMYGKNTCVPGYHIVDKISMKPISIINPYDADIFERTYLKKGIMSNGSTYFTLFSGDASESYLTTSVITRTDHYQKVPFRNIFLAIVLNPITAVRLTLEATRELVQEFFESVWSGFRSIFEQSQRNPLLFSLMRVAVNVLGEEVSTYGAILDMKRGLSPVWINFIGYDELGHHRGPHSKHAYRTLRHIDRRIGRLIRNTPDDYDIYIFSDHGMTESVPFYRQFGYAFENYVRALAKEPARTQTSIEGEMATGLVSATLAKIAAMPALVLKPFTYLAGVLYRKIRATQQEPPLDEIAVEESSGLCHIYFTQEKNPLSIGEIEKLCPGFVDTLAQHPACGVLCVRTEKDIAIYVRGTRITKENESLLGNFGPVRLVQQQLQLLMRMKYCGDVVVMGDFDGKRGIAFGNHYGMHSGLGGPQNDAFIMAPKELLPTSPVTDLRVLHELFGKYQ